MTFSLCMIVRNEERTLKRCLDSVAGVFDEIVIVDTGRQTAQRSLQRLIPTRCMTLRGVTTFPPHVISRFQKRCATT